MPAWKKTLGGSRKGIMSRKTIFTNEDDVACHERRQNHQWLVLNRHKRRSRPDHILKAAGGSCGTKQVFTKLAEHHVSWGTVAFRPASKSVSS
jgi:hypothetical protein